MYTTNSEDSVFYVLNSSQANIVIVDDSKQMDKIQSIRHKLPNLKAIIQTVPPYQPYVKREDGLFRWSELEEMNVDDMNDEFNLRLESMSINECCCLVYTSGTVGTPKGMLFKC